MGWLRLVTCFNLYVSFAKEPSKRDDILQKRPTNLRSLLIVATPYKKMERDLPKFGEATPHNISLHAMQSTSDRRYEAHRTVWESSCIGLTLLLLRPVPRGAVLGSHHPLRRLTACSKLLFIIFSWMKFAEAKSRKQLAEGGSFTIFSVLWVLLVADRIRDFPIKLNMKLGPQTDFGAKSQSKETIQLVPEPRKMVIIRIIPRRRSGTWEGVTVVTWYREWNYRMWGAWGLGPHTLIFPALLSLPLIRGAATVCAPIILQNDSYTPESPILSNLQFCWLLSYYSNNTPDSSREEQVTQYSRRRAVFEEISNEMVRKATAWQP